MRLDEYLSKFERITRKPTLDGMKFFMEECERPHEKPKFIHIAGTNGKGSVCEMISRILVKAGYKVRQVHFASSNKL